MSKIQSIHINNFKFFGESEPIELDGKNLLLYGENGSGKSSIYNALYTLMEAAAKEPNGVQKYFQPLSQNNSESLINIHANEVGEGQYDSYIEVEDDKGKSYRLSYADTALCGDDEFRESQRASGFINYQSLFHFQLFRNSEKSNLHEVFKHAIIPYLPCSKYEYQGKELATVYDLFRAYLNYETIKQPNHKGKLVIYKGKDLYKNYLKLQAKINEELSGVIEYVNEQLPHYLHQLGYSFNAYLRFTEQGHKKYDRWLDFQPFGVYLEIDEYDGKKFDEEAPIIHPNVFLNEAKMSALAFAIRWAILTKPAGEEVATDRLRIIVLDDLMISLDMSNREKMIRFLLDDAHTKKCQLLFLTHERMLFDAMFRELGLRYSVDEAKKLEDEWVILEMYDHEVNGKHFPLIQPHLSAYGRALAYFNGSDRPIDYMASGNSLRQAIEGEFKRIFQFLNATNTDGSAIDYEKLMIGSCIKIGLVEFPKHNLSIDVLKKLDDMTWFSLNPLSHDNPYKDFYRSELESAFKVYNTLLAIKQKVLIPQGTILTFDVERTDGSTHHYEMQLHQDLYTNIDAEHKTYQLLDYYLTLFISEVGNKPCEVKNTSFKKIYSETIKFLKNKKHEEVVNKSATIYDEIKMGDKSINQLIEELFAKERRMLHIA